MSDTIKEILENNSDRFKTDPVLWVETWLKIEPLEDFQKEALRALVDHRFVSLACGGGVGKTALQAFAILWFLVNHPYCNVIVTAPTQTQIRDVLWKELIHWIKNSRDNFLQKIIDWNQDKIYIIGHKEQWFVVQRTARLDAEGDVSEAASGFHSKHGILVCIDEASGVDEKIFAALQGALTDRESFAIMTSNPTRSSGTFYNSFHSEKDLWHTIHVSALDSPRVTKRSIERFKRMFGEFSDVYRAKVLGEFPKDSGGADTLFDAAIAAGLDARKSEEIEPHLITFGLDVARYGSDLSVLIERQGFEITNMVSQSYMDSDDLSEWAWFHIHHAAITNLDTPIEVNIDAIGYGAAVADNLLRKARSYNKKAAKPIRVHAVEYMRQSTDEMFFNVRTESFFEAKDLIPKIRFKDDAWQERIYNDMIGIKYIYKGAKMLIESKDDIKKKKGGVSPDFGDAFILALNNYSNKSYESIRKIAREHNFQRAAGNKLQKNSIFSPQKLSTVKWSG